MKTILKYFIGATLTVLFVSVAHASSNLPAGIEVSASLSKNSYVLDDALMVSVTYRNVSDQTVELLKWNTALNGGLTEDLFSVEFLGEEIPYVGVHAKRLAPTKSDYVQLLAGQSVSGAINLLGSYPINFKGEYKIAIRESGALNRKVLLPLTLNLAADRPTVEAKRTPSFQNCSSSQRSTIDSALSSAERIANVAIRDLRAASVAQRPNARRYREWFGAYEAGRYGQVETRMARIASALSNQTIGFNCDCTGQPGVDSSRTFAFVFPNDPYNMTLCDVFFQVPRDGTDSKSGTIVHEVSHFTAVAGTRDVSSNQAGIRSVAMSDPGSAIEAANAYEYFAENTPFLSMPQPADLIVASSVFSNSKPVTGRPVFISGAVRNQGDGVASSTSLKLTLTSAANISITTEIAVPSISQGSSFDFQLDFRAPSDPGDYSVELCVTAVNQEANTNNNCAALSPLLVSALPIITPILPLLLDD